MAAMSRKRLARHLVTELSDGSKDRKELVRKLAAYLVAHKRTHDVEFLIGDVAAELARRGEAALVRVTTARPLGAAEKKNVQAFIQKELGVRSVELDERIDPDLIGGIVIETPDARYDRSLKRGIEQLLSV